MFDDIQLYAWQHNVKVPIDVISVDKDNFTAFCTAKDGYKLETQFVYFNSVYYTLSKSADVSLWRIVDSNGEHIQLVKRRIDDVFGAVPVDVHAITIQQPVSL